LSRENIYRYIFKDLLGDWRSIDSLGLEAPEKERNIRKLCTVILFHFFDIPNISWEEETEPIRAPSLDPPTGLSMGLGPALIPYISKFIESEEQTPYTWGLPEGVSVFFLGSDLSYTYLRGISSMAFGLLSQNKFTGSDLRDSEFFECNFSEVYFNGACLKSSSFANVSSSHVDFSNADLSDSFFGSCYLPFAIFEKAILDDSIFMYTDVSNVYFSNVSIRGADFSNGSNCNNATFRRTQLINNPNILTEVQIAHINIEEDVVPNPSDSLETSL